MRFEEVPVARGADAVLAHTHRLGSGAVLKKGRRLTHADCEALAHGGVARITVARLERGDVDEDEAARRVADAVAGPHVRTGTAITGRANLFAATGGLLLLSCSDLDRVNLVDEAITVATAVPWTPVRAEARVATVKIIPFAVREEVVERACAVVRANGPPLAIAPFSRKRAGVVLTLLPGIHEEATARTAENLRRRMEHLGGEVAHELRVPHDAPSVARAIESLLGEGVDLVLVLGASAIVDRQDVIPQGIEGAGGSVDHLGMPVEPGNLLLLGRRGSVPVIGVPGCARALKRSGFDWILERLAAGVPVGREDIMRFGVGGLLGE
jgi:molybdenum cofactor cytidylyltransferase